VADDEVAGRMTERVVDIDKIVHVQHQQLARHNVSPPPLHLLFERVAEPTSVR
jgi:hypothetical protein